MGTELKFEGADLLTELMEPEANPQLFPNSPLKKEYPEGQSLRDPLRGVRPPNFAIVREKPEHRILLLLKLKGLSNREIAEQTGYSECWVSQITRQPWFQDMLVEQLGNAGDRLVDELIALEAKNSVYTLIELRDNPKESGAVRRACAVDLLTQFLGKPIQRTENLNVTIGAEKTVSRLDNIDAEIKALEEQVKQLTGNVG